MLNRILALITLAVFTLLSHSTFAISFSDIELGDELTLIEDIDLKETESARTKFFSRDSKLTVKYKMTRITDATSSPEIQNENLLIFTVITTGNDGTATSTNYEAKATGNEFSWLKLD